MNKRFILPVFFITGLGLSAISAEVLIETSNQTNQNEILEVTDTDSAAEIKIIQALAEELEKRIADVKTEAGLKALVEETQQLAAQFDECAQTDYNDLCKIAAFGAAEGLLLPIVWTAIRRYQEDKFTWDQMTAAPFAIGVVANAVTKVTAAHIGTLPKAQFSDMITPAELTKSIIGSGLSVAAFYALFQLVMFLGSKMDPKSTIQGYSITALLYAAPALANALPSSAITLLKRLEKRNNAKHVIANLIAHRDNN